MVILGIETSCDETALALVKSGDGTNIEVLAEQTLSQAKLHAEHGGVFPNLAKREHAKNLLPLFRCVLEEAGFLKLKVTSSKLKVKKNLPTYNLQLTTTLEREPEMLEQFLEFIPTIEKPSIDAIAVTEGPGLEPCLWTGINLAKALSLVWDIPIVPVNHMEGHVFSALLKAEKTADRRGLHADRRRKKETLPARYLLSTLSYPALALLISGGHTELALMKDWFDYEIIGQTRDDAVGEAFDKVARLLGLPYPGGPEISALAEQARNPIQDSGFRIQEIHLPRPMVHSGDFDFSFSGLKTAVLYLLREHESRNQTSSVRDSLRSFSVSQRLQSLIAKEFENAVTEVLIAKTEKAMEQNGAKTLLIGGGVIANIHIRRSFEELADELGISLFVPELDLTTDNALMIATTGALHLARRGIPPQTARLQARGNLRLAQNKDL